MTATPIPRTLLLSVHGDLDVSQLTEKPAGRKPVATRAVPQDRLEDIVEGLHRALREGAQVYWVCPAVDSETARDMAAAEERAAHLRQTFGERVGLVHGRLSGAEKDAAIAAFTARNLDPRRDHRDRGRRQRPGGDRDDHRKRGDVRPRSASSVARPRWPGSAQSSCVLLYKAPLSETAKSRLDILRQVEDGFVIAEEDLRLRGGGEILDHARAAIPASVWRNGRKPRRSWTARPTSPAICSSAIPT